MSSLTQTLADLAQAVALVPTAKLVALGVALLAAGMLVSLRFALSLNGS